MISRALSRKFLFTLSVVFLVLLARTAAFAATSVCQFGITWTFDRDYTTGQFANGDHWVVGPVKVTNITPRSVISGGVTMHGSMVNPPVNGKHGYDSRIIYNQYDAALNVGLKLPLTLPAGSSLVSSISNTGLSAGHDPQINTLAILTVLGAPAPAGSFRPAPVGTDKTLRWNKAQLNYAKLRSLPIVANTPSLASVEALFVRPWNEQGTTWISRYLHAGSNQPTYGREIAHTLAQGLLSLQLNYTNAQKEKLLIRLVQYGIDVYGSARLGAIWPAGGGHNQGRKMPMILAGTVLGDANILSCADGARLNFQEDRQTWFVRQSDVGRVLYNADGRDRVTYVQADVGIPEWGEQHVDDCTRDSRTWGCYYRDVAGACTIGHVLAARLMNVESTWNWPAAFDYYDRFFKIEAPNSSSASNEIQPFVKAMWTAYRNSTPAALDDSNVATAIWANLPIAAQTGSFTVAFDLMPSANLMNGVTGLSNGAADCYQDNAASVRFAPNGYIDARNGAANQAAAAVPYKAGVKYHFVMTVNVPARIYSVTVTPAGGATVTIANNWAFRTEQSAVSRLNNIGFIAEAGAHAVLNVGVSAASSSPTPTPSVTTVSTAVWGNQSLAAQTGNFTVAFDLTPSANRMNGVTGLSDGAADGYQDNAAHVRFNPEGYIDARNGSISQAAAVIPYTAGVKYRFVMNVNVPAKTYSVTVTPAGGSTVSVANNWRFRNEQASETCLKNLSFIAEAGSHSVLNVSVTAP